MARPAPPPPPNDLHVIIKLDLEDTFGDIIRKASRGRGVQAAELAARANVPADRLANFMQDAATPTEDEARAIGRALKLDPGKLADIALGRWKPVEREQGHHIGHQVNVPHPSNGYFLILEKQRVAAFVDPGGNTKNIVSTLQRSPAKLDYILITHKHADHIDGVPDVRRAFPSARIAVHRLDAPALGDNARGALQVADGDSMPFGDGQIRVVHTPGHTDGSICFIYQGSIFTGDTLFAGSVGGCFGDRFGYDDLLHGAATKIFTLPDDAVVLPGHGPPSTIEEERAHNPFF
jgi:glyoxylase-like metal-dependent hydrolase (beta-lactamase superfamily II)